MNIKRILSFWRTVLLVLLVVFALLPREGKAVEKLDLGTSIKFTPAYYLPILAAEDKGFFKEQGLEVEWVPFQKSMILAQMPELKRRQALERKLNGFKLRHGQLGIAPTKITDPNMVTYVEDLMDLWREGRSLYREITDFGIDSPELKALNQTLSKQRLDLINIVGAGAEKPKPAGSLEQRILDILIPRVPQ